MEAVALFSFTACVFFLHVYVGCNCACACVLKDRVKFMSPCVCSCRWFAGPVSRLEAEQRLRWQDTGVFLVRESESAPGEFSVSVSYGDRVEHFRVLEGAGQYGIWDESFSSLNRMVDFYRTHSIAVDKVIFLRDPPSSPHLPPHPGRNPYPNPYRSSSQESIPSTAHLHFRRGDVIDLLDCSSSLSWRGRCRGRVGVFPPDFVRPLYH
uniref:GRB2 related adaptor protein b n=1 Tax=Salarias fasciatus TaxID=181472 RepID=A0A672GUB6_SALFA